MQRRHRHRHRRFVITGASSGIGRALAISLAQRGASLTLGARNLTALDDVARECSAAGGHAIAIQTDVSDKQQCARLIGRAVEEYGGLDCLVNNAGISMWARLDEVTDISIFERLIAVNYLGAVYCTWHALPFLVQSRGLVCAISSLTGKTGVPTRTGYAASKHALQGFCDSLRIELRNTGVDVLVVSPGFVATAIRERALGADGASRGASPRDESNQTMSTQHCVQKILRAIDRRDRDLLMTPSARIGMLLKLLAPRFLDRIAARSVGDIGRR